MVLLLQTLQRVYVTFESKQFTAQLFDNPILQVHTKMSDRGIITLPWIVDCTKQPDSLSVAETNLMTQSTFYSSNYFTVINRQFQPVLQCACIQVAFDDTACVVHWLRECKDRDIRVALSDYSNKLQKVHSDVCEHRTRW